MDTPPPQNHLRAAILLRVSTEEQAREGHSIGAQKGALTAYVTRVKGYSLNPQHIFTEDGFSGSLSAADRPVLRAIFTAAERREFDILLVYRLDRFFRDLRLLIDGVNLLNRHGVHFASMSESFDSSTPTGTLIFHVLGSIAEWERAVIKERAALGRREAIEKGIWVGSGTPAYGLRFNKQTKQLEPDPTETSWLIKFFEWVAYERLSIRTLQKRVNAASIPTKWDNLGKAKSSGTKHWWHTRTLNRILTNEIYTGTFHYRKLRQPGYGAYKKDNLRPRQEWIEARTPQLLSRELFDLVQHQLKVNRERAPKNTQRLYLFSKLLYCANCGHQLCAAFSPPRKRGHSGSKYYRGQWIYSKTSTNCRRCGFYAETRLDASMWPRIQELIADPAKAILRIRRAVENTAEIRSWRDQLAQLNQTLEQLAQKKARLDDLYIDGALSREDRNARLAKLLREEQRARDEVAKLNDMLLSEAENDTRTAALEELCSRLAGLLHNATYETRQQIYQLLIHRVVVSGTTADVHLNVPKPENGAHALRDYGGDAQPPNDNSIQLRDYSLIRSLAIENTFTFVMPVSLMPVEELRRRKLWRNAHPHLRKEDDSLPLR